MDIREAAFTGDVDALRSFIEANDIDINNQHPINLWTALHWAVKGGYTRAVEYLCRKGADVNIRNKDGNRPLDMELTPEIAGIFGVKASKEQIDSQAKENHLSFPIQGTKPRVHWSGPEPKLGLQETGPRSETDFQFSGMERSDLRYNVSGPVPGTFATPFPGHIPGYYLDPALAIGSQPMGDIDRQRGSELCLMARLEYEEHWIEFPLTERTHSCLTKRLIQELQLNEEKDTIRYIVKSRNILVRNDWDVSRLQNGEELTIKLWNKQ